MIDDLRRTQAAGLISIEGRQRLLNDTAFTAAVFEYMTNPGDKYQFGGVMNCLSTVSQALWQMRVNAELLGLSETALDFAIEQVDAAAQACDIRYSKELS